MTLEKLLKEEKIITETDKKEKPRWKTGKSIIIAIIGLIFISVGSDLAVDNCTDLAYKIGISEKLITMFVLVIGTSTPELILAITSAKKKEFEIY